MELRTPIQDLLAPAVLLMLLSLLLPAQAADWHGIEEIRLLAEERARQLADSDDVKVDAASLDQRLRLPRCKQPLESFTPPGTRAGRSLTIGVRCTAPGGWSLYVPVRMVVYREVAVTTRTLRRGTRLHAEDLRSERQDVTALPGGWFADPQHIVGQQLRRDLVAGQVVTPALLRQAVVIARGQQVTLLSRASGVEIRARGEALSDGMYNQRIKVRNNSSGRVVEGIVRSADTVEVAG